MTNNTTADEETLQKFEHLKRLLWDRNANFLLAPKEHNGPNLYLVGLSEFFGTFGNKDKSAAKNYFELASQKGHLPSRIILWRAQSSLIKKIVYLLTVPYYGAKFVYIAKNYPKDIRVLH